MKGRPSMNLFEIMHVVEAMEERLKEVEKLAHEPQNYREKCDEMEKKINRLERRLRFKNMYNR